MSHVSGWTADDLMILLNQFVWQLNLELQVDPKETISYQCTYSTYKLRQTQNLRSETHVVDMTLFNLCPMAGHKTEQYVYSSSERRTR